MSAVKVFWACKNCGVEMEVSVTPVKPAQTYGPPENCYPEEGGEHEPENCECGWPIDSDAVQEKASSKLSDMEERYADEEIDRRRDEPNL